MTPADARLTSPGMAMRAVQLSVLTLVMTFAIAVAAEAFSPPVIAAAEQQFIAAEDCAAALTVRFASSEEGASGTWLKLVKSDAACAVYQ